LEEQVGGVLLEGDVADFVDDEQSDATQPGQLGRESARVVCGLESGDPIHGGGGHTTWHCTRCPDSEPPIYGPALNTHCRVHTGPDGR
jgi:hypothetical protein